MSRYTRSKSRRMASPARRSRRNLLANSGLPGYDNLGWDSFGHPASSEQPSVEDYGIDSEFGEGVRKGPYRSGPAPASYGWTPDHPASSDSMAEDYEITRSLRDENLKKAMERKAAKCIRIAESRLGKFASQREIEDLALRFMDLPNSTINSRVASLEVADDMDMMADDFEADDMDLMADFMADDMDMMADDFEADDMDMMADDFEADDMDMMADDFMADDMDIMADFMADDMDLMADDFEADEMDLMADDFEADEMDMMADFMADDFEADDMDMMADDFMADDMDHFGMDHAEVLSEEIAMLKAANARLARKVRNLANRFASDEMQQATGHEGEEEESSIDSSDEPSGDSPTQRLARIERLANALSDYMMEMERTASETESEETEAEETEAEETEAEEKASKKAYRAMKARAILAEETEAEEVESEETEAEETEAEETSKKAYSTMAEVLADLEVEAEEVESEDPMGLDASDYDSVDPRLASIFTASDEEDGEVEAEETEAEEKASKKASYKPSRTTRQASVKTLGNISREASTADELSKLWESAPDVSKFFG